MDTERKQRPNVSIDEYLALCKDDISLAEYLAFEEKRVKSLFKISPSDWVRILSAQSMKCYYCDTDLTVIQQLILHGVIKPRKRGRDSYSGLHFELDHRNCDNSDNCDENVVASCYYCNNDRSNVIPCDIYKEHFGTHKNAAIKGLSSASQLPETKMFRHHLKGRLVK